MFATDVAKIVEAAKGLPIEPRAARWCHLSLCVIDAVFSIGARYGSTWRAARRYADSAGLAPATAPATSVAAKDCADTEQTLEEFLESIGGLSDDDFADLLGNRQRTSTRNGILKALAVRQYIEVLAEHGVQTLDDVSALLASPTRLEEVESSLKHVRGHGSGARVAYLWMLAGDDHHVKPDRMVIGWASHVLGRSVRPIEASALIVGAASALGATPWELDHAIWRQQSGRSASTG